MGTPHHSPLRWVRLSRGTESGASKWKEPQVTVVAERLCGLTVVFVVFCCLVSFVGQKTRSNHKKARSYHKPNTKTTVTSRTEPNRTETHRARPRQKQARPGRTKPGRQVKANSQFKEGVVDASASPVAALLIQWEKGSETG